jgi:hypothetical protein
MISYRLTPAFALLIAAACSPAPTVALDQSAPDLLSEARATGMVRVTFPDPDPGVPAYARLGLLANQVLHDGEWLAVPMLRDPACIPADFNLLRFFHFPGPDGPGAFACPLRLGGWFMIEADAPQGTFPRIVHASGNAVPFWFVRWQEFQPLLATGTVTIEDLEGLPSLVRGVAERFEETLQPRPEQHRVMINARGRLETGGGFRFHLTHIDDRIVTIRIDFGP